MTINRILISCSVLLLFACSDKGEQEKQPVKESVQRSAVSYLNEDYARIRSRQVDNVHYSLAVSLSADEPEFSGQVDIGLDLLNTAQPLTIDFSSGTVRKVLLNGEAIAVNYNNWFITIDQQLLKKGPQQISVEFSHPYSKTGSGLYRFTDPEDDNAYVYSDLEPYDANHIFPVFDQPDIKATYELQVEAPAKWLVVSSRRESDITDRGDRKLWKFPRSEKFSTYIFSLHAGPYHVWEDNAADIPLRLMARQTLAQYVDAEDWFEISRQGFEFFEDYFDIEYPFHKYDQLIVPDFNSGAMENVAAVTFSERYIKRGSYTVEERERIANVLLHEMAHMWFGNLVTMDWWNGLWLNESFATYMASLALVKNTAYTEAWHTFFTRSKLWAYDTDEQVTNHPIELPVNNTDSGFANFDGITYGKGASVLKQLSYLLDPEIFRQGVSQYLKERSYRNSELTDFTSALADAADRDLQEWVQQWLYTKGINGITVDYQCEQGKIASIRIDQDSQEEEPVLREHRLDLGLFNGGGTQKMELAAAVPVTINGTSTEPGEPVGMPCPDFIYPNYGDWAFAKVRLQERELELLANNINNFDDPLMRSMLWRNLWEAVRDARLPLTRYAEIVLANIPMESNLKTLNQVTANIEESIDYFYSFQEQDNRLTKLYQVQFETLAWERLNANSKQADLQKIWLDHYVYIVHSPEGLGRLKSLLNGEASVPGLDLDQDRRWEMVKRLGAHAYTGIETILEKERTRDPSSNGEKAYVASQAIAPELENKQGWLKEIQDDKTLLPLAKLREAMRYLYPSYQIEFRRQLLEDALQPLATLDASRQQQYLRFYSHYMLNGYCRDESNQLLQKAIEDNQSSSLAVTKSLRIALQEDQRCLAIKALVLQ